MDALLKIFKEMAQNAKDSGKKYVPLHVEDLVKFLDNYERLEGDLEQIKDQTPEPPNSALAQELVALMNKYHLINEPPRG